MKLLYSYCDSIVLLIILHHIQRLYSHLAYFWVKVEKRECIFLVQWKTVLNIHFLSCWSSPLIRSGSPLIKLRSSGPHTVYKLSVGFYLVQIGPVVHVIWQFIWKWNLHIVTCDVTNALNDPETITTSLWTQLPLPLVFIWSKSD